LHADGFREGLGFRPSAWIAGSSWLELCRFARHGLIGSCSVGLVGDLCLIAIEDLLRFRGLKSFIPKHNDCGFEFLVGHAVWHANVRHQLSFRINAAR
jgi:hypothetical protein